MGERNKKPSKINEVLLLGLGFPIAVAGAEEINLKGGKMEKLGNKLHLALLAALLFLASGTSARADSVEQLDSSLYRKAVDESAEFELPVSFVKFENLRWTRAQIIFHVQQLAEIYRQCSIRVGEVKIYSVDSVQAPEKMSFSQPTLPIYGYQSIAELVSIKDRPLAFLVNGEAATENEHISSFSVTKWKAFPQMPIADSVKDTVWLIHQINSDEYDKEHHPFCEHCVLAHELGHVLMRDSMHNGDNPPNLMSGAKLSRRNRSMPSHICAEIRENTLLKKLRD